jgi:hypothetical protein
MQEGKILSKYLYFIKKHPGFFIDSREELVELVGIKLW